MKNLLSLLITGLLAVFLFNQISYSQETRTKIKPSNLHIKGLEKNYEERN